MCKKANPLIKPPPLPWPFLPRKQMWKVANIGGIILAYLKEIKYNLKWSYFYKMYPRGKEI